MKKLTIAIVLLMAFACTDENEIVYSVDPALESYVDTFYQEASERGLTLPKNLIAEVSFKAQAIANGSIDRGQKYVYVSESIPMNSGMERYIFNALGEVFVHNKVTVSGVYDREAFFNELFK